MFYFGARYYDPAINRFITLDTTKGSLEDPLSLNRYIYARDNPERYVDPTGNMFVYSNSGAGGIGAATFMHNGNLLGGSPFLPGNAYGYWGNWNTQDWANSLVSSQGSSAIFTMWTNPLYMEQGQRFDGNLLQYGPPSPTTTTSTTAGTAPLGGGTEGQARAIVVTSFFFIGSCLAVVGAVISSPTGFGPVVLGAAAVGLFAGGLGATYYTYKEGPNATPSGAAAAGAAGTVDFVEYLLQHFGVGGVFPELP